MAERIPDTIHGTKDGPIVDPFVIQKFLEEGNTQQLRRSVSLKNFLMHVHSAAQVHEFTRGLVSSQAHALPELFFAAIGALRLYKDIPHGWQLHLLKLIQACGYDKEQVVRTVREFYASADKATLRHLNIAARQLNIGTIFELPRR